MASECTENFYYVLQNFPRTRKRFVAFQSLLATSTTPAEQDKYLEEMMKERNRMTSIVDADTRLFGVSRNPQCILLMTIKHHWQDKLLRGGISKYPNVGVIAQLTGFARVDPNLLGYYVHNKMIKQANGSFFIAYEDFARKLSDFQYLPTDYPFIEDKFDEFINLVGMRVKDKTLKPIEFHSTIQLFPVFPAPFENHPFSLVDKV